MWSRLGAERQEEGAQVILTPGGGADVVQLNTSPVTLCVSVPWGAGYTAASDRLGLGEARACC